MFTLRPFISIKEMQIQSKLDKGHSAERIADNLEIEVEKVEEIITSIE